MVQVDESTKYAGDATKFDTFTHRHPANLLTTDHTAGNYHSKFPIRRSCTMKDYLQIMLVVAMQLELRIMRSALALGMQFPQSQSSNEQKGTTSPRSPRSDSGGRGNKGGRGDGRGGSRDSNSGRGGRRSGRESSSNKPKSSEKPTTGDKKVLCYVCGKPHPGDCMLRDHPDANLDPSIPWTESKYGKIYGQRIPPVTKLPNTGSIAKPGWTNPSPPPNDAPENRKASGDKSTGSKRKKEHDSRRSKKSKKDSSSSSSNSRPSSPSSSVMERRNRTRKSKDDSDYETENEDCKSQYPTPILCTTTHTKHDYLLTCFLSTPSLKIQRTINCLVDTGALDDNYVSEEIGDELKKSGALATQCERQKVCSCSSNVCFDCLGVVHFSATFKNEITNIYETIALKATIIDSDFDLIIGRRDIFKYDIIRKTYEQLFADLSGPPKPNASPVPIEDREARVNQLMNTPFRGTAHSVNVSRQDDRDIPETSGSPRSRSASVREDETRHLPQEVIEANKVPDERIVHHRSELLSGSHDCFEDQDLEDEENQWDPLTGNVDPLKTYQVHGPATLQVELRKLLLEYNDVFSDKLSTEAARLHPMTLEVNEEKWMTKSNRLAPRPTSTSKQEEIRKQIEQMLDQGLIRPSKATAWSQVLLVPKPNDQWRFCVDFRRLNDATRAEGWPIPNIKETLNRIGRAKAKYFATMDLTKGFY